MTWIVTIHDGGGSTAEAVDVEWGVQLANEAEAKAFADALNGHLVSLREDYKWAQYFEVLPANRYKLPRATTPAGAAPPGPGQMAIDMLELARMIHENEDIEVLPPPPPPVSEADKQAAIDSIMKGS